MKTILAVSFAAIVLAAQPSTLHAQDASDDVLREDGIVYRDAKGRIRAVPLPMPDELVNEWPAEWEDAFWDRANEVIRTKGKGGGYGNTWFENEKRTYPNAMFGYMAGFRKPALDTLQDEDAEAKGWNKHTEGIDFYPCFTLKGQMRKYFQFGPVLRPEYRERMKKGATAWTEKDPLRRPNEFFKRENQGKGWGPDAFNSWVDVRHTDNLQAMREAAVYLMAEETGNEEVRKIYADRIRTFVTNMYQVGMGEWDSENYLGHTFAGYLNLYDFAKDKEIQTLAKAALDHMATAMAIKYCWGAANGPDKRDYNPLGVFVGSLAAQMALYAGNYGEGERTGFEPDEAHLILSRYRPPAAVIALARKDAKVEPFELFAVHSHYDALRKGADAPDDYETTYFGGAFQLGSLDRGTGRGDVNGFKAVIRNPKGRGDYFLFNCTRSPKNLGSPQYAPNPQIGRMNVGQYRSTAIVLNDVSDCPFMAQVPAGAALTEEGGISFLDYGTAWIALRPLNASTFAEAPESSKDVEKAGARILSATGKGGAGCCGFVVEIGDKASHKSFDNFRAMVKKATLDDAGLASEGAVTYKDSLGHELAVVYGDRPRVRRDGVPRDFAKGALWCDASGDPAKGPVYLGWKEGTLRVTAGGHTFTTTVPPAP